MAASRDIHSPFHFNIISRESPLSVTDDCIVGIRHVSDTKNESQNTLHYVEILESLSEKLEERTFFRSSIISQFPFSFRNTYTQDDASFLQYRTSEAGENHDQPLNLHIIVSTGSGNQLARTCYENQVAPFLKALNLRESAPDSNKGEGNVVVDPQPSTYHVHTTDSAESIIRLAREEIFPKATKGKNVSIILLSGDGGIVDLLNGMMSSEQPLPPTFVRPKVALVPTGTGNALANSTGILSDRTLGLSTLYRGRPRPLPTFKVHLSPDSILLDSHANPVPATSHLAAKSSPQGITVHGAVVCSFGLHASLVANSDTPDYRKHGSQRFQMAAKDLLFPPDGTLPHEYRARVSVLKRSSGDETPIWHLVPRETHAYVLVTLVSQLEKGFTISPASTPLDGKLRVVHFGPMGKGGEDIMEVMKAAYGGGKHVQDERVVYEEVEGLKIDFAGMEGQDGEEDPMWRRICVDGKIFVVAKGGSVTVEMEKMSCLDLMWLGR